MLLFAITFIIGCSTDKEETPTIPTDGMPDTPPPTDSNGVVSVVITSGDGRTTLNELNTKLSLTNEVSGDVVISIDQNSKLQRIEGFGGALTGSSAFLLRDNSQALDALFRDDGIRLNYTRLTVGASDFNRNGTYTYNDITSVEDITLQEFSIAEDFEDDNPIIPVVKNILAINADMGLMASPWTAPAWMKNNRSFNGGSLLQQYYGVYSAYLIKYLEAYRDEGILIDAITVQNEPLYEANQYPTMKMTALEQATFIGDHFGPLLRASSLETQIIGYDHNFREPADPDFPLTLMSDPEASSFTNGIAFHAYDGNPSAIDIFRNQFPNVDIYFTEQSGIQNSGTTFGGEIDYFLKNVFVGTLRRGAKTVLLWNLALDQNGGPINGGCTVCRGILTVNGDGTFTKNVDYYILGHFSKYVDTGARVLATNPLTGVLENVAFENPDGSKVLVVYNGSNQSAAQNLNVTIGNANFQYAVPQGALVTFKWN